MNKYHNQSTYWDRVSSGKEFSTQLQIDLFANYVSKDARVLDHGCGYGRTLHELQEDGYTNLYGTDSSPKMIARAAQELSNITLAVSDGEHIPFASESFDAVMLIAVLTSVIENEAQQKMISELKRVLKPSGYIYINDFLLNQNERNISRYKQFQGLYVEYGVYYPRELCAGIIVQSGSSICSRTFNL